MIERPGPLALSRQCELLGLSRAAIYYRAVRTGAYELELMALIDRQYLQTPFYGSRRVAAWLQAQGHAVNRKRVQRLMQRMGLAAIYQRPRTSRPALEHRIYPYLLRGLRIERVGQVWAADITYSPMGRGFLYLVAVMDWVSRYVLAWRLSNLLDASFCIELVDGRDLVCVDHKLYMKMVGGLRQVEVLYRRIEDDFLDPLVFRPDSMLGVPGLTAVLKAGGAVVANGIGTGVCDDKAVYAYTPAMIRYYLGEEPILPIVHTYLLRDHDARAVVLRDLDKFVVKPTGGSGGYGVVIGPMASDRELAEARERIEHDPAAFIAQPVVQLSVHPTITGRRPDGSSELAPRHIYFRPFVLLGARPRVLPGGLTRVALREGSLIVNSSQGGGSKDTWVLAS
jgi:hypothetical protein